MISELLREDPISQPVSTSISLWSNQTPARNLEFLTATPVGSPGECLRARLQRQSRDQYDYHKPLSSRMRPHQHSTHALPANGWKTPFDKNRSTTRVSLMEFEEDNINIHTPDLAKTASPKRSLFLHCHLPDNNIITGHHKDGGPVLHMAYSQLLSKI